MLSLAAATRGWAAPEPEIEIQEEEEEEEDELLLRCESVSAALKRALGMVHGNRFSAWRALLTLTLALALLPALLLASAAVLVRACRCCCWRRCPSGASRLLTAAPRRPARPPAGGTSDTAMGLVSRADVLKGCSPLAAGLKSYQLVGINYLMLLYRQRVGGGILVRRGGGRGAGAPGGQGAGPGAALCRRLAARPGGWWRAAAAGFPLPAQPICPSARLPLCRAGGRDGPRQDGAGHLLPGWAAGAAEQPASLALAHCWHRPAPAGLVARPLRCALACRPAASPPPAPALP
jgi:hypothetical protein